MLSTTIHLFYIIRKDGLADLYAWTENDILAKEFCNSRCMSKFIYKKIPYKKKKFDELNSSNGYTLFRLTTVTFSTSPNDKSVITVATNGEDFCINMIYDMIEDIQTNLCKYFKTDNMREYTKPYHELKDKYVNMIKMISLASINDLSIFIYMVGYTLFKDCDEMIYNYELNTVESEFLNKLSTSIVQSY